MKGYHTSTLLCLCPIMIEIGPTLVTGPAVEVTSKGYSKRRNNVEAVLEKILVFFFWSWRRGIFDRIVS